jgi:hypothetical protein
VNNIWDRWWFLENTSQTFTARPRVNQLLMASDLLVALGIVSAPEYIERRAGSRATWLTWPNICAAGCAFRAQFVVRMRDAPPSVVQVIEKEEHDHSDVLRVDVLWNETRLRGPVLSVAAWLTHAVRAHSSARCIAKLDDDAYIHLPGLEVLVREALGTLTLNGWFILRLAKILAEARQAADSVPYAMVVIDALYRSLPPGVDENDNSGIARVYNTLDQISKMCGASMVCVGRPYVWGLGAFGEDGVGIALRLLDEELLATMRQCGVTSVAGITKDRLADLR